MKKILLILFALSVILVGCGESETSDNTVNDNPERENADIRQEVWDESIKIANAVNYFVTNEIIVPAAINIDLLDRWFPELEFTDSEKELYDSIIDIVMTGHGIVSSDFDEYNINAYNEDYDALIEIIGEENITDENLDMEFVEHMKQLEDDFQAEQNDSLPSLILEDTSCANENGYIKTKGFIRNDDSVPYSYVRVKVTYKDENNNVVDTDWGYAVDSQPLQPNDRRSYEILATKNSQISNCSQVITEYQ